MPVPPALGLLELSSIAVGIYTCDAMVKSAPIEPTFVGTVHPGKFVILVTGDVASVDEAMSTGRDTSGRHLLGQLFLPDAHPFLQSSLRDRPDRPITGDAMGIVETKTVAAIIGAADRGLKSSNVVLNELRLADGLGGKAYCCFGGEVADVEEAIDRAVLGLEDQSSLVARAIIPRLDSDLRAKLGNSSYFHDAPNSGQSTGSNHESR